MEVIIRNLLVPVEKDAPHEYRKAASVVIGCQEEQVTISEILGKSLDTRDKRQFYYDVSLVVTITDPWDNPNKLPMYSPPSFPVKTHVQSVERPIIIGSGPAGLFAALELIEYGIKPIIFERGEKIEKRDEDVQRFINQKVLNTESNIQFGEGGAGTYSDGKLFSRVNNSRYAHKVLDTFIAFGAPEEIAYVSKPHLGTDVLCTIVRNMREYILDKGGEIYYGAKMTDLIMSNQKAAGVIINNEREYFSSTVYLAIGHSARDTFEMLYKKGVLMEQKPISIGVRIEHPVEDINRLRYGDFYKNFPGLGAASYSFTFTDRIKQRGVYTFCMCPGGEIVNASSQDGLLVLNGMSYSHRSSAFSNGAIVVTVHTDHYPSSDPLAGIEFQKDIERKAFAAGGATWAAPAQNLHDYLSGTYSSHLNRTSFKMGVASADLREIFPEFVNEALCCAFAQWKQESSLFVSHQALLLAAETRTSCPLRIKRNTNCESVNISNLFAIGEGSGYTGGITSSASDAIKAVECRWG
ncbi:MAG: FAD-dependent protein [Endomicrobiales bacterium]